MTTLKQLFKKHSLHPEEEYYDNRSHYWDREIEAVREWLQQKLDNIPEGDSQELKIFLRAIKNWVKGQLLEELNQ